MELYKELSELDIARRIINGEKSLFEIIVRRYNPYLYKVGRSYKFDHEDTQDLMQETFIDTYRNLDKFEGRSAFKTWIIRIMLNNCYRKRQKLDIKNKAFEDTTENSPAMSKSEDKDNGTEKIVQTRELAQIIEEALTRIPEDYRMVFSLREINGLNVAETASLLNISEANVKVRLNRSKAMLRELVEKSYSANELYSFNAIYCDAMTKRVMDIINKL